MCVPVVFYITYVVKIMQISLLGTSMTQKFEHHFCYTICIHFYFHFLSLIFKMNNTITQEFIACIIVICS